MEKKFERPNKIKLKVAKEWRARFKKTINRGDNPFQGIQSFVIPRASLEDALKLETKDVRAYFAINDDKELTLIFVGTEWDEKEEYYKDYFKKKGTSDGVYSDEDDVEDGARFSPPFGDFSSPLNQ